jgi:hypothetical protein
MYNLFWSKQRFVVPLLSLLILSACDDPSPIGLNLVDSQSGDTQVTEFAPSFAGHSNFGDVTGGTNITGAVRTLFGTVSDPVVGPFSMTGYMDFINSSNVSSEFRAAAVSFADLELNLDYIYGDTLNPVTLDIYEIGADWISESGRADSFLDAQSLVTSTTVMPEKGVFHIPLPSTWISGKDAVLRSTTFVDEFHGFALRASQGSAVLGVHFSGSSLRASSVPGDTVNFSLSKVLSASSFVSDAANPEYLSLRDGAAETISLRFPFESKDFGEAAFHRVIIRLNSADVSSLYPVGFERSNPIAVGLRAVAVDETTRLNIIVGEIAENGTISFDSATLANVVQSSNLANSGLDRFELYFPVESNTVGIIAFKKGLPATFGPRAVITYTSLN